MGRGCYLDSFSRCLRLFASATRIDFRVNSEVLPPISWRARGGGLCDRQGPGIVECSAGHHVRHRSHVVQIAPFISVKIWAR